MEMQRNTDIDGATLIHAALGVPLDLLHSEEAVQRAAAAALLRRTPVLEDVLSEVERPNVTNPDAWNKVEKALIVSETVIKIVAGAVDDGFLDPVMGRYPTTEQEGREHKVQALKEKYPAPKENTEGQARHDLEVGNNDNPARALWGSGGLVPAMIRILIQAVVDWTYLTSAE